MLDTRSLQYIDPFCPQGGSWFACPSGSRFLGCCTSNPCQNGCLDGNLKPASFNGTDIGQFADQECVAGQFYTCEKTNPPFLGCCKSNPCQAGQCPQTDLTAAFLSNDPAEAADFLPNAASATAVTLSVTEGSSITVATAALAPTSSSPSAHTRVSNGAIIGIALGGFVFCVCLLAISMFLFARRSRVRQPSVNEKKQNAAEIPNDYFLNASSPGGGNRDSFSPTSLCKRAQNLQFNFSANQARLFKRDVEESSQPRHPT